MAEIFLNWGDTNKTGITLTGSPINISHTYANNSGYIIDMSGRTSEVSGLTLSGTNITDISGFTDSKLNLSYLNLSNNKIKTLPYVNNNLKHLYLNNNQFISGTTLTGTTTDYDGNIYTYVTIGSQQWMVQNLKTTHYADGTVIPNVTGNTTTNLISACFWESASPTGYSYFNSSTITISSAYTLSPTTSRAKLVTNSGTTQPTALRIYFSIQYSSTYYLPRLIVTDQIDTEYLNTTLYNGGNEFIIDVIGSTGKFTLWLYNTDQNKLNPYPTQFNSLNSLQVEGYDGWPGNTSGAYAWYNDNISYKDIYGGLYNWNAVNNVHGLSPTGWRIPTNKDWSILTSFVGGDQFAAYILKETGTTHWNTYGGSDRYGFTALPGGYRTAYGFSNLNYYGNWWSSDRYDNRTAKYNYMYYNQDSVMRDQIYQFYYGMSVRCMRDITSPITNQYSGTSLETLNLDNGSFKTYSSGSLPTTMHNFSANNTSLDSNSVSNILNDMYNNTSSKNGMTISLINTVGALTGMTQKYNLIDNSGSTIYSPGRFQILVDRTSAVSLYRSNFRVAFNKPVTPTNINILVDWGDNVIEAMQFNSASTYMSLVHRYLSGGTYVANFEANWDYITGVTTQYSHYNFCPIDVREFVGLKRLDLRNDTNNNYDNLFGGTLNLSRNNALEELVISSNKFSSMIYPTNPNNIKRLELDNCTGVVAPPLNNMPDFEYIYAQYTNMTGNLTNPSSKKITYFNIYSNPTLTAGAIPDFTDCTGLTTLQLYNSNRNSNGTTNFMTLSALTNLELSNNSFSLTPIVPTFNNLNNLSVFNITSTGYQWIGDTIWDSLTGLTTFQIQSNGNLSGATPSLSGATKLTSYYVYNNKFYGPLPNFSANTQLTNIDIQYNYNTNTPTFGINGPFPDLTTNTKLNTLRLSNNYLNREFEVNSTIVCMVIDATGRTYLGGNFTRFNTSANFLVRLNPDGSRDTSFNIGTGFNSTVNAIAVDLSGKSYIGGNFTTFNGLTQKYFVKLNEDGSKDTSCDIGTVGFNNPILAVGVDLNGKIYAGGNFSQFSGTSQGYFIRLNSGGTKDTSFDIGIGFNTTVNMISVDTINDKIYVGGIFTQYSGTSQKYFVKLNNNATKDTSFDMGTLGFSSNVYSMFLDPSGKIYIGGDFTTYSGLTQNRLIRLDSGGTKDTSFDIGTGFNSTVYSIALDSSGNTYVGGNFTTFNGNTQRYFVRLDSGGTKDTSFDIGTGFSNIVYSVKTDMNDKSYIAGGFSQYSGNTQKYFIRLNSNATKDTSYLYYPNVYTLDLSHNTGLTSLDLMACNIDYYHNSLSALTQLTSISMYQNNLTSFPNISRMTNLQYLYLYSNQIRTDIPTEYSGNTQLRGLYFSSNQITGTIPEWFGRLSVLSTLDFSNNQMSGSLPLAFTGMTNLTSVALNNNNFTSGLTYLSGRTNLNTFLVQNNNFSGITLFDLSQFNNATQLNFSSCNLYSDNILLPNGSYPGAYQRIFNNNWFIGNIPPLLTTYSYYTSSVEHRFNNNYFTGYTSMVGSQNYTNRIYFQNNYLGVTEINKVLADAVKAVYNSGTIDLSGPYMAVPTGQGLIDADTLLLTKNWSVTLSILYVGNMGLNNTVNSIAIDTTGNIYAGGNFTSYSGTTQNRLVRIDSGGTKDTIFATGTTTFSDIVWAVDVDNSGKTYVGGQFSQFRGSNQYYILRLDSGGTLDSTFDSGTKLNGHVYGIKVDESGRTYAVGTFTAYSPTTTPYLMRLDTGGTLDTSFVVGNGFSNATYSLFLDSNNKIYVGGEYTSYKSISQNRLIRLDSSGTKDASFNIGTGFNSTVYAIAVDPSNGNVYVGGNFTQFNGGPTQNRIIRLDSGGTWDTSFQIGTGFNSTVRALALDGLGNVYVGGDFTQYSGQTHAYLAKLDSGGTLDTSFNIYNGTSGLTGSVQSIKIDSNGKILIGGNFYTYKGTPQNRLLRLNTDGSKDTSFNIGDNNTTTVDSISNRLTFTYTGTTNTTAYLTVTGTSYVISNSGTNFVWDLGGSGEYKFTSASTITRNLNGTNFTIQWVGGSSGNLLVKIKKV